VPPARLPSRRRALPAAASAFVLSALFGFGGAVHAQSPVQLSLLDPIQIVPEAESIRGIRLTLLYGQNQNVSGLDLAFIANRVRGDFRGLQGGLVGIIDGNSEGVQWNVVNLSRGDFLGAQVGAFNQTMTGEGVQLGWVNHVRSQYNGLQISFVNYAQRIDGVQIGLVNIIKEGGRFPIFPIVNWGS
jgi:hypothetical protein